MIDAPAMDTWLARLLLERQRFEVAVLQDLLAEVRGTRNGGGHTLARSLVVRGLLPEDEALRYLQQLASSPSVGVAADRAAISSWQPGRQVGDYVLLEQIGAGGMGAVFMAQHAATGVSYAIKTLLPGADPDMMLRFQREAEAQAAVDAHPNIVRVHTAGSAEGRLYLVMDLASGGDLQQRLRGQPTSPEDGAAIVAALARGLHHAHQQGVLHRDLKPANVMFDDAGTPKLVDFGLARVAWQSQALTKTGDLMGTPSYMAPEQARGDVREVDARADVYGLGAILYEVLTGRPPFVGGAVMKLLLDVIQRPPERPGTLREGIPTAIEQVCLKALSKRADQRQPTALALAEELEAAIRGEGPERSGRKGPWVFALLVLFAVVGGLTLNGAEEPAAEPPFVPDDVLPNDPEGAATEEPKRREAVPVVESGFPVRSHRSNPEWIRAGSEAPLPKFEELFARELSGPYPQGTDRVQRLYELATNSGEAEDILRLAEVLGTKPCGVANRKTKALGWFLRARELGAWLGTLGAAKLYATAESRRDYRKAARLFVELARDGTLPVEVRSEAQKRLGNILRLGDGSLYPDSYQALEWFHLAYLTHETPTVAVRYATLLIQRDREGEDYDRIRAVLLTSQHSLSMGGEALTRLGDLKLHGKGGENENETEAEHFFKRAAQRSHDGKRQRKRYRQAMLRLGALHRRRGGPENLAEAVKWFELAARDDPHSAPSWFRKFAHFTLYEMYESGELRSDEEQATTHLDEAKRLGHPQAAKILKHLRLWRLDNGNPAWCGADCPDAALPLSGLKGLRSMPPGPYANEGEAITRLRRKLEADEDPAVMVEIGDALQERTELRLNRELAIRWYQRARMAGSAQASYKLALAASESRGLSLADPELTLALTIEAARAGHVPACLRAGELLRRRAGEIMPDLPRALGWYEEAVELAPQNLAAVVGLSTMLLKRGRDEDITRAQSLLGPFAGRPAGGEALARLGDAALLQDDPLEAEWLYRRSALGRIAGTFRREKNTYGMLRLAQLLRSWGGDEQTSEAAGLLAEAAKAQRPEVAGLAAYQLYRMHAADEEGAPKWEQARAYLEQAATAEIPGAVKERLIILAERE